MVWLRRSPNKVCNLTRSHRAAAEFLDEEVRVVTTCLSKQSHCTLWQKQIAELFVPPRMGEDSILSSFPLRKTGSYGKIHSTGNRACVESYCFHLIRSLLENFTRFMQSLLPFAIEWDVFE